MIEACPNCGKQRYVRPSEVGCLCKSCHNAKISRRGIASNLFKHGGKGTTEYNIWCSMRQRCENPRNHAYSDYGERGIQVCPRWRSFKNFLTDMGKRPTGLTLDRINNDGNYELSNCRWATNKEQAQNRRAKKPWSAVHLMNAIVRRCVGAVN